MRGRTMSVDLIEDKCELSKLKILRFLFGFLIITLIVMPQYFGVHIGYDITCSRLADLLIIFYMLLNRKIFTHFFKTIIRVESFYPLVLYLFVAMYTMVYRADVNAFFSVFFEILNFILLIYGIRYVIGYRQTIKWILGCAYFLSVYGLVEFVYGRSIYLQFLSTLPNTVKNIYRSGHYRIMGPCGHSLGYGLLLVLFIAIACYDIEKDKVYVLKRPVLLVLLYINVVLTGSRSTLGIVMVELVALIIVQKREEIKKSLVAFGIVGIGFVFCLVILKDTSLGNYMLGQVASVIDTALNTNFSASFGIDMSALKNSTEYRKVLPYIFTLDWLNPLVGRGRAFSGAEINGVFIHSIDNYYVSQYIKYAYPGLISYCLFLAVTLYVLMKELFCRASGLVILLLIALVAYFYNLWWVDALQTLKFIYLLVAVFYAYRLNHKN